MKKMTVADLRRELDKWSDDYLIHLDVTICRGEELEQRYAFYMVGAREQVGYKAVALDAGDEV